MEITQDTWTAWEQVLGEEGVVHEQALLETYEANACGWDHRLAGALRPRSTQEVQAIVRISIASGATLHAVSCGRNWGYNSRLPTERETGAIILGYRPNARAPCCWISAG